MPMSSKTLTAFQVRLETLNPNECSWLRLPFIDSCHDGKPVTRWWTPEVKGDIKWMKELYQAWIAFWTSEAGERYRHAARVEAKTSVWEEFVGTRLLVCLKAIVAKCQLTQEEKVAL